ncbi:MAG: DUF1028 domain-containing protein [Bacteroidia bacterium]|nr:DUF1028 domain-containing protein [Bacteroidia bacterium]
MKRPISALNSTLLAILLAFGPMFLPAQDTFSIVAVDSVTGEVGSAGASCVNLLPTGLPADFLGDLFPGIGAINSQAYYLAQNQSNARMRMLAGDNPSQIIAWLIANDIQGDSTKRQYGVVRLDSSWSPSAAAHTGTNTDPWHGHRVGPNYSIQGNILLGAAILDSMEYNFLNTPGNLATKLMAALQGANVVGADTRCASFGTSSHFSFLKVAQPTDPDGQPSLLLTVKTAPSSGIEPIDSLQSLFNIWQSTTNNGGLPAGNQHQLTLSPNPANQRMRIEARGFLGKINYEVFDLTGKSVMDVRGEHQLDLDISGLAKGTYILEVTDVTTHRMREKFIRF